MKIQLTSYLSSVFFFKIAVGAILLAIGWDSMEISGNGLLNITIIMALSFFPATFARPIFQRFSAIPIPKLLALCLCISGSLIMIEYRLMDINRGAAFTTHFILWIFIFIIEVACEKWYVTLSQGFDLDKIRKLSGLSTSVAQLGIVIGPLTVMLAKEYSQALPYWIIALSFIISMLFSLSAVFLSNASLIASNKPNRKVNVKLNDKKLLYVLGFALIWPTLTVFNLSIPVLAKTQYNSINVAGTLEILIAIATVIAGFAHPYITRSTVFLKRTSIVFIILFISALSAYLYNSNLIIISLGVFLLGMSFGYLRIELRAQLSRRFEPKVAGEIVASANGWSGLIVIIYAVFFYICTQIQTANGLTVSFPISFVVCAALFVYILNHENKNEALYGN